jgi:glutamate dehydrogenase
MIGEIPEARERLLDDVRQSLDSEALARLSSRLFARAPKSFLSSRTPAELAVLVRAVSTAATEVPDDETLPVIRYQADIGGLIVALTDRPFIITSIRESLRFLGIPMRAFLHPIIEVGGRNLSVSFIDLGELSADQVELAVLKVSRTLKHVIAATRDFLKMNTFLDTVRSALPKERGEERDLCSWLEQNGFIFLGTARSSTETVTPDQAQDRLGVLALEGGYVNEVLSECLQDCMRATAQTPAQTLLFQRLRPESRVHRRSRLLHIAFLIDGGWHSLIGIVSSDAQLQPRLEIPVLRQKIEHILLAEEAVVNSHDYKNIVDCVNRMPLEEALTGSTSELRSSIQAILHIQDKNETQVTIRIDDSKRGASVLMIMPRDRFNADLRERLQSHLESTFGAQPHSSEYFLDLSNQPQARLYFHIPLAEALATDLKLETVSAQLVDMTRSWLDNLEAKFAERSIGSEQQRDWLNFRNAFGKDYQTLQTIADCEHDITQLALLGASRRLVVSIVTARENAGMFVVIVYRPDRAISVSEALPVIEKGGFEVVNETTNRIQPAHTSEMFVHRFLVRPKFSRKVDAAYLDTYVAPALERMFCGEEDVDALSGLTASAGLSPREIDLLRTYVSCLWQLSQFASRGSFMKTLRDFPELSLQLVQIFREKFDPESQLTLTQRSEKIDSLLADFRHELSLVQEVSAFRTLRAMTDLIRATQRTNFYQRRDTIVVKLSTPMLDFAPRPKPLTEMFVWAREFEGIHLRSSLVARGGIRWSDRNEDFRAEVLGLMKTQRIKNALIVPQGAKGGFAIRELSPDPKVRSQQVIGCYKRYISALLSVADNRQGEEVIKPLNTVVYDGDDSYLVVAADKGTATFSDIANEISVKDFNFWLGDAFASGGSNGYDHKKYGITARGAWESVERHLKNIGLQLGKDEIRLVGIGDMSGDVFGNGLLYSEHITLIAAFNHRHIFVDPTPDPLRSFAERKRLFELPGSQWSDYTSNVISAGGGIFDRTAREITLSNELRKALSVPSETPQTVSGEDLIRLIMLAEVELFWNGGIGTYVKARTEAHAEVNDSVNDGVRVDAEDLRARIIGEGGNLGFTQRARIAFARRGGQLFTDAIDNSGGVDLSDHEVNLKILFQGLLQSGTLTRDKRDTLMLQMAPEVVTEVLSHNRSHAKILTIGARRSRRGIEYFGSVIRDLEARGYLDRRLESLPEDEDISDRARRGEGLLYPELAVCLAGVKMWVKEELLASQLPRDAMLQSYLFEYFPASLKAGFEKDILNHPLSREIIATQATNTLIDTVGITFVFRMCRAHSARAIDVIKCALAAEAILNLRTIRRGIELLDTTENSKTYLRLNEDINASLRDATSWLLSNFGQSLELEALVGRFRPQYETFLKHADTWLIADELEVYLERLSMYEKGGIQLATARALAFLPEVATKFEVLHAALESGEEVQATSNMYFEMLESFGFQFLISNNTQDSSDQSKWDTELLSSSYRDLRRDVALVARHLLSRKIPGSTALSEYLNSFTQVGIIRETLNELDDDGLSASGLAVLARRFRDFVNALGNS